MNKHFASLVCLALASLIGVAAGGDKGAPNAPQHQAVEQEAKKLQGTWKVVGFEVGGTDQTAKGPKELIFKGDELQGLAPNVKFRIDPTKKPKTLDLIDKGDAKKIFPMIYELEGNALKIAFSLVAAGKGEAPKRPEGFQTKDKPVALITAKREKP
jgi:uncharacterized protein (TIGR03067 family)